MIKTTNAEAIRLLSPVLTTLITEKIFPIKDGYWISRLIKTVTTEVEVYQDMVRGIVAKYEGKVEETDGMMRVTYPSVEIAKKANQETRELGDIEIELPFDKVVAKDSWPALTLAEITLLDLFTDFTQLEGS